MADLAPGSTHGRIRSELERRITGGAWPVGTRLPPEPVLARQLGVSRGTLRRALGTLREHGLIEAAPRRGSFVISAVRTTAQRRQIGVVVPSIAKPSAASLVQAIEDELHRHGYSMLFGSSGASSAQESGRVRRMLENGVSGFIAYPIDYEPDVGLYAELKASDVPLVFIDRYLPGLRADAVVADNVSGAYEAVKYLADIGHRRIGFVSTDNLATTSVADRLQGYRQALVAAGLTYDDELVLWRIPVAGAGWELTESQRSENGNLLCEFLSESSPTAVFTLHDRLAFHLHQAAAVLGRRVPDDLSIVAFSDDPLAQTLLPGLTVVEQPRDRIGRLAAQLLVRRIQGSGEEPARYSLATTFHLRRSTAPPSAGRRGRRGPAPPKPRDLAAEAMAVLRANDAGSWTKPSAHQYPHQWNWDSALVSLGWALVDWQRAVREIESLLHAQWISGMLPHIRYDPAHLKGYFPGPDRWPNADRHHAPEIPTSGISNPPVLVTAVRRVAERAPDAVSRHALLSRTFPALERWLNYLARERQLDGCPLISVVHPWETGWDNSPRWDHLQAAGLKPRQPFTRRDTEYVGAEHRPEDRDYDAYLALIELLDGADYDVRRYREVSPFVVYDVFFDACWYRAATDLNAIAESLGARPPFERGELDEFAAAFQERHWDAELNSYFDYDVVAGRRIVVPTPAGIAATLSGLIPRGRAERMWTSYTGSSLDLRPVWTLAPKHPAFDPVCYWRGPVWVHLNWLIALGLATVGLDDEASALERHTIGLVEESGFSEHYSPVDGLGGGAPRFSWPAALVLELLGRNRVGKSVQPIIS